MIRKSQWHKVQEANRRVAQAQLKCCPLCDSLNSAENEQCFVCGWSGQFCHDPVVIEREFHRILDGLTEIHEPTPDTRRSASLWEWLRARLRRRLDLRA